MSVSSLCLLSVLHGFIKIMLTLIAFNFFSQVMKIINISQNQRRGESTSKSRYRSNQKLAE